MPETDRDLTPAEYATAKAFLLKAVRRYNCRTFTGHVVVDFEVRHFDPRNYLVNLLLGLPTSPEGTMDYGIRNWSVVDE